MSVLSHLQDTASKAVLSSTENSSISTSVSFLQDRIKAYFGSEVLWASSSSARTHGKRSCQGRSIQIQM